jgi:predicted RNA-binding protein with EMAP domain
MGTGVGGATPADQTCIGVVHGGFFTVVVEAKVDIDRGGKRIGVGSAVLAGRAHAGVVRRGLFTVGEAEADCRVSVAWSRGRRCCHQLG